MATKEIKTKAAGGKRLETYVSAATHRKLKAAAKKKNTSIAQLLRDAAQALVK